MLAHLTKVQESRVGTPAYPSPPWILWGVGWVAPPGMIQHRGLASAGRQSTKKHLYKFLDSRMELHLYAAYWRSPGKGAEGGRWPPGTGSGTGAGSGISGRRDLAHLCNIEEHPAVADQCLNLTFHFDTDGSGSRPLILMQTRTRPLIWFGPWSDHHFNADPGPTFLLPVSPGQIVILVRIRIWLFPFKRIRLRLPFNCGSVKIRIQPFLWSGSGSVLSLGCGPNKPHFDADLEPFFLIKADKYPILSSNLCLFLS